MNKSPKLWLFLVGINNYHDKNISSLKFCENDCYSLLGTFSRDDNLAFEKKDITLLTNKEGNKPTKNKILSELKRITENCSTDDAIVFGFFGHGFHNQQSQKGFVIPVDAIFEDVEESSIELDLIHNRIKNSVAKHKLIILDACHTSLFENQREIWFKPFFMGEEFESKSEGIAVLSSCKKNEKSVASAILSETENRFHRLCRRSEMAAERELRSR